MKRVVVYIHGKGGNAEEAEHYKPLFDDCDVVGFDYKAQNPWQTAEEFAAFFDNVCKNCRHTAIVANSIGAYFALNSLADKPIEKAYFVSPVVDMERLICDMMSRANVTEAELRDKKLIETEHETLSWEYLCYVRSHPIRWTIPTDILYGQNDVLQSYETMSTFAERVGATLTVMQGGKHWFHTEQQTAFLDSWISEHKLP